MSRVDFGFAEEATAIDERSGGFPDVRVPTLIVHGVNDPVVDVALSRAWSAGKRHVRLVEVDDGHELAASLDRIKSEADAFLAPPRCVSYLRTFFTACSALSTQYTH